MKRLRSCVNGAPLPWKGCVMLPTPGKYRLTGPAPSNALVEVFAGPPATMVTTFGTFTYDATGDLFVLADPTIFVECLGNGAFRATWGNQNFTGTCVAVAP